MAHPPATVQINSLRPSSFFDLQRRRVRDILLVASEYDAFILEEEGRLGDMVRTQFSDLELPNAPHITSVPTAAQALEVITEHDIDLVITMLRVGELSAVEFGRRLKELKPDLPLVLLSYEHSELTEFLERHETNPFDRVFLWQGDVNILFGIVKDCEDRMNAERDIGDGVQAILLVEDSVQFYSSYLPRLYEELLAQSRTALRGGLSVGHRWTLMRARPKILLSHCFEDAVADLVRYRDRILGVISDVDFPREGRREPAAGFEFAQLVAITSNDVHVVLQSRDPKHEARARDLGATFLRKGSPRLLEELAHVMRDNFSFGPFEFRTPEGETVAHAEDVHELQRELARVDGRVIRFHAERNHFSRWLRARAEFALAKIVRPRKVGDFESVDDLRTHLINAIREHHRSLRQFLVEDFDPSKFDPSTSFARVGTGSLGGKARGLAFVNTLLSRHGLRDRFPDVRISVPPAVVLATGVFDDMLADDDLRRVALEEDCDEAIQDAFLAAKLPDGVMEALASVVEHLPGPIAVRSSSLLEDSQFQPFAGVYETIMLPNDSADEVVRLRELREAVLRVYASTFSSKAKTYLAATHYRLEEEKMAVIVQRVVGRRHDDRFYPDFSGTARSHNDYPFGAATPEDGIATLALGLGRIVVDDGLGIRVSPRHPKRPFQFSTPEETLQNAQKEFDAIRLHDRDRSGSIRLERHGIDVAVTDGTLARVGSVWSAENDVIYDGIGRPGVPLVTFASVLKHDSHPLPKIIDAILGVGQTAMSAPVEIEFAGNFDPSESGERAPFCLLQMRPLVTELEAARIEPSEIDPSRLLCRSRAVRGAGRYDDIFDIVYLPAERFDRSHSRLAADEIADLDAALRAEGRPYLLAGMGRWGSSDPWLGIPVTWNMIAGARVIVETAFPDIDVAPSLGSHLFQNLIAMRIGYLTVPRDDDEAVFDWGWLAKQPAHRELSLVRHVRLDAPLTIMIDSRNRFGVIMTPERE